MNELERRLRDLGRVDIDRDLSALEDAVWSKIDARAWRRLLPIRAGTARAICAAAALTASVAGGLTAAAQNGPAYAPLSLDQPMAPSTALSD